MTPEGLTEAGYEIHFSTNVMGAELLRILRLPLFRSTAKQYSQARVLNLASASESRASADIYDFAALTTPIANKLTTERYTSTKIADFHYTSARGRAKASMCGF